LLFKMATRKRERTYTATKARNRVVAFVLVSPACNDVNFAQNSLYIQLVHYTETYNKVRVVRFQPQQRHNA
jgi:hypothetical protein